jgi:hypothetical protein
MTNANSSNTTPSDIALLTGSEQKQHYNTNDGRVFLAQQAADARIAIQHTVVDIQVTAREVANIRWWTQQYPWYAIGAATVLGFVGATSALALPKHHVQPDPPVARPVAHPSWMVSLFEMVRSLLTSIILDALHPPAQQAGRTQADANAGK